MPQQLRFVLPILGTLVLTIMTIAMLLVALVWSSQALGAFLLAILFGAAAIYSAVVAFRQFRHRQDNVILSGLGQERSRILKLAAQKEGLLTAQEAAMECRISIQQAEALLDDLASQGQADLRVTDSGSMVYAFPGLLEDDKATAEDPMKMLEP